MSRHVPGGPTASVSDAPKRAYERVNVGASDAVSWHYLSWWYVTTSDLNDRPGTRTLLQSYTSNSSPRKGSSRSWNSTMISLRLGASLSLFESMGTTPSGHLTPIARSSALTANSVSGAYGALVA